MAFDVGYGAAALAGLLSFLSPCILPIVPFYLCYLTGVSYETLTGQNQEVQPDRRQIILSSILFAIGVAIVFVMMGATATTIGQQFREWFDILKYAAAALILVMGLHFLGVFRIPILDREARVETHDRGERPKSVLRVEGRSESADPVTLTGLESRRPAVNITESERNTVAFFAIDTEDRENT